MEQSEPAPDMTLEELAAAQAKVDAAWPELKADIEQMLQEQRDLEEQIDAINAVLFPEHADLDQKQADE